jgi:putative heme-binding domain-containing protein
VGSVQAGLIPQSDVAQDHLRQLAAHHDAALDAAVTRLWGKVRAATPEERLAVIRRLNNDLRADSGNSAGGKVLFNEHCAKCHRLHGEGNQVGPDLTTANRSDREFLLVSLVDPSANVRKEYLNQVVQMTDGRILTGIVVEETDAEVTLLDANNQRQRLVKSDIEELKPAENSLMPEGLLEKLSPGQLRDLFSYLQQTSSAK